MESEQTDRRKEEVNVMTITEMSDINIIGANADTVLNDGSVVINALTGERAETVFRLRLTPEQARKVATELWHGAKDGEKLRERWLEEFAEPMGDTPALAMTDCENVF
jgi:hypothetical protein